jgi:hypothetical protein
MTFPVLDGELINLAAFIVLKFTFSTVPLALRSAISRAFACVMSFFMWFDVLAELTVFFDLVSAFFVLAVLGLVSPAAKADGDEIATKP